MIRTNRLFNELVVNQKYISKRKEVIRIILATNQKLEFCSQTFFNSILFLDIIFYKESTASIQKSSDFVLYGLCCLIISAKFNENDPNVPELKKFSNALSNVTRFRYRFNAADLAKGEIFCLQNLNYKVNYYSIYQFISFFFVHGIVLTSNNQINRGLNEALSSKFLEQTYYISRQILNFIIEEDFILIGENCALIAVAIFRKSIEFLLNKNIPDVFNQLYNFNDNNENYIKIYEFVSNLAETKVLKGIPINKAQYKRIREEVLKGTTLTNPMIKNIKNNLQQINKEAIIKRRNSFKSSKMNKINNIEPIKRRCFSNYKNRNKK